MAITPDIPDAKERARYGIRTAAWLRAMGARIDLEDKEAVRAALDSA